MARKLSRRQHELFKPEDREDVNFFERRWDAPKPISAYGIDSLTPWFQMKMEHLSVTERVTLREIFRANQSKSVAAPFTLEDLVPAETVHPLNEELTGLLRRVGIRAARTRPLSQTLSGLLRIGVLRLATEEEKQTLGEVDSRLNVYVLTYPRIEEWWRMRNNRYHTERIRAPS